MKTTITFITLLFLCFFKTGAQDFGEFAPIGAEWWYSAYRNVPEEDAPPSYEAEKYVHYKSSGEVFFAGKSCRRIDREIYLRLNTSTGFGHETTTPEYVYSNGDTVFFYEDLSEMFVPMYFFNAAVGDTLSFRIAADEHRLNFPLLTAGTTYKVVVDSIVTLSIDGHDLRGMVMSELDDLSMGASFSGDGYFPHNVPSTAGMYLQRLGAPLGGFIPPTVSSVLPGIFLPQLLCYTDADITYTPDGNPCTFPDRITAIHDADAADAGINVYPNPANGSICIDNTLASGKPVDCVLLDITGRSLAEFSLENGRMFRDISSLTPGMYLLRFSKGGQYYFKKIIKQ